MTRDNEDRLGVLPTQEAIIPPVQVPVQQGNNASSLSYVMPTELVEIPSEGKLYPVGHPLRDVKEIEIKYMTAKEEDILTSKSLLKKGTAIDKMIESLLVDRTIKIDDLILGDKNALILAARKSGYGSKYDTEITCPLCENKAKFSFDLDKIQNKQNVLPEGVKQTDAGTFFVTLPKSKVEVEIKPITGKEEKMLLEIQEQRKKDKQNEGLVSNQMKVFVVSVDGAKEKSVINSFVEKMPAMDAKFLRQTYRGLAPDVDMRQEFTCSKCDHEEVLEVPLTITFFWPE